jgi:integrase
MNVVDACNRKEIEQMKQVLKEKYPPIYADVWNIGLNMSLRISDLLSIKYEHIDAYTRLLTLTEAKTGKRKEIRLNDAALSVIARRKATHPKDTWLFESNSNRSKGKPITRGSVSKVFNDAGQRLGINVNSHSMRKSRGAIMYKDGVPLPVIARVLNHSSINCTLRYIGITKEETLQTFDDYQL